jgi:hypothetical protein
VRSDVDNLVDRAALPQKEALPDDIRGYLAATLGVPVELAIQGVILLTALTCDPAAIALTVAASRPKNPGPSNVSAHHNRELIAAGGA